MDVRFETKHGNKAGKDEWLTPPDLLLQLGTFDLDPCAPIVRPWDTALNHFTIEDDGLSKEWYGTVWCNPPYGDKARDWLLKCAEYGNCIALTFARTETRMFFDSVWDKAHSLLFIKGRLSFYHVDGTRGDAAGAPSVLISYNEAMTMRLEQSGIKGKMIYL